MELKKTPLFSRHESLGARFVEFAGWLMPLSFSGIVEEHLAVRNSCGVFDVSHMGEIVIEGPRALEAVQLLTTNDALKLKDGTAQYTLLCNPGGGVVDDCLVYRFDAEKYLFCVNASNTEKAYKWIEEKVSSMASVSNESSSFAQLAVQGPLSAGPVGEVFDFDPAGLRRYHFVIQTFEGSTALVSRTGYTGEDGFEIYIEPAAVRKLWDALLEAGKARGTVPAGLGARDTLRLEMGYPLYGHELDEDTTPIEAGLERFVSFDKGDFIGRKTLEEQKRTGVERRLAGFRMKGRGIPRRHYDILYMGRVAGRVTSGTFSPSLKEAIGMGYVEPPLSAPGTEIEIAIRNRAAGAVVEKTPFYRKDRRTDSLRCAGSI